MCQLALGHYFLNSGIDPLEIWHATRGSARLSSACSSAIVSTASWSTLPGRKPGWRSRIERIESADGGTLIRWKNGWRTVCPPDDNPHVYRADGRPNLASFEEIDPGSLFYFEPHDIGGSDDPAAWESPGEALRRDGHFPPWQYDTIDYVVRRAGSQVSVHGEVFSSLQPTPGNGRLHRRLDGAGR